MWKVLLAGTTALAIAGSSLAYAQQRTKGPDGAQHWRPSAEDVAALTDARISALKAALKLTPDQEKNWPAFEQALRDRAKQRLDRMSARRDGRDAQRSADPIERMRRHADRMVEGAARMKKFAEAMQPLYQSLDEGQKQRFTFLMRALQPHPAAFAHGRHHGGGDQRGPGDQR